MRTFQDQDGASWLATALEEEESPRHHGRWYLVIRPEHAEEPTYALHDVRWQSRGSAERTLRTMADWELQRRLAWVRQRAPGLHGLRIDEIEPQPLLRHVRNRPSLSGDG
ncbi:MAG: hypothetical protein ACRELV_04680 [Longimicrobiales bacterium]